MPSDISAIEREALLSLANEPWQVKISSRDGQLVYSVLRLLPRKGLATVISDGEVYTFTITDVGRKIID